MINKIVRIFLGILGISGFVVATWGLYLKFTIPIPAESYGIILIGLCLGLIVLSTMFLWAAITDNV